MSKAMAAAVVVLLAFAFVAGGASIFFLTPAKVVEVEISPEVPEQELEFYVSYLKSLNYTVRELSLYASVYENVSFKEFLWVLDFGNFSNVFIDYGEWRERSLFLSERWLRAPKLWIHLDGIYWEVRVLTPR